MGTMNEYFVIEGGYKIECYLTESLGNPPKPENDDDYEAIEERQRWNSGKYLLTMEDAELFRARLLQRLRQMNDDTVYDRDKHKFTFEPWLSEDIDSDESTPLYTIDFIGDLINWGWVCDDNEDYDRMMPMIIQVQHIEDNDPPFYYGYIYWEDPTDDEWMEFLPIFRTHGDAENALYELKALFLENKKRVAEVLKNRNRDNM